MTTATKPTFFKVPPGTKASKCNGKEKGGTCEAPIYFIRTARGKWLPVDCNVEGGTAPSVAVDDSQLDLMNGGETVHEGWGVAHFGTCVDRQRFHAR